MYYNKIAKGYDKLYSEEQTKKAEFVKNLLRLKQNDSLGVLLDAGGGTGCSIKPFLSFISLGVNLDPSIELLKQCSDGIFRVCGEVENLPFKDKSFDIVISITAFQNVKDIERGIKEILRIAKPEAKIVISILKQSEKIKALRKILENLKISFKEFEEEKDLVFVLKYFD